MSNLTKNYIIFFCGISKNCIENIEKNLDFLFKFTESSKFNSLVSIIESDSNDGTKQSLKKYKNINNFYIENIDNLESKYSNRIERILISRNACIENIVNKNYGKKIIYVPMDLDIDLFKYVDIAKLESLIEYSINKKNNNALFPFSLPYYYDIFALRAEDWVNYNAQLKIKNLKKYFSIGSFFVNYIYIFRHQISNGKYKNKNVSSAFGGMGIYNLNSDTFSIRYIKSKINPELVSEHILFNKQFKELEIVPTWNLPAPPEHLEFRLLNLKDKVIYFFKTIYFDIFNRKK